MLRVGVHGNRAAYIGGGFGAMLAGRDSGGICKGAQRKTLLLVLIQ